VLGLVVVSGSGVCVCGDTHTCCFVGLTCVLLRVKMVVVVGCDPV